MIQGLVAGTAAVSLTAMREAQVRAGMAPDCARIGTEADDASGFASW